MRVIKEGSLKYKKNLRGIMLSSVVTVLGLAVAVIIFLNLLSAKHTVKNIFPGGNSRNGNGHNPLPPAMDARKVYQSKMEVRPRICPLCGTLLEQSEYLYAALEPETANGRKRQAHIYGCRYCFSTEGVNLKSKSIGKMEPP